MEEEVEMMLTEVPIGVQGGPSQWPGMVVAGSEQRR